MHRQNEASKMLCTYLPRPEVRHQERPHLILRLQNYCNCHVDRFTYRSIFFTQKCSATDKRTTPQASIRHG